MRGLPAEVQSEKPSVRLVWTVHADHVDKDISDYGGLHPRCAYFLATGLYLLRWSQVMFKHMVSSIPLSHRKTRLDLLDAESSHFIDFCTHRGLVKWKSLAKLLAELPAPITHPVVIVIFFAESCR